MKHLAILILSLFLFHVPLIAETKTTKEGTVFLPSKAAEGNPVLVIVEFAPRGPMLLQMMQRELEKFGVAAIIPKIAQKDGGAKGVMNIIGKLLAVVENESGGKIQKKYVFGFSAAGDMGASVALRNSESFDGLVLAAPTGFSEGLIKECKNKGLPIIITCGANDPLAQPAQMENIRKALIAGGIKNVDLTVNPNTDHVSVVMQKSAVFLEWIIKHQSQPDKKGADK